MRDGDRERERERERERVMVVFITMMVYRVRLERGLGQFNIHLEDQEGNNGGGLPPRNPISQQRDPG